MLWLYNIYCSSIIWVSKIWTKICRSFQFLTHPLRLRWQQVFYIKKHIDWHDSRCFLNVDALIHNTQDSTKFVPFFSINFIVVYNSKTVERFKIAKNGAK